MIEPQTTPAKYIFLDVVGFTHNRSVEAQSDIVHALNSIVRDCIAEHEVESDQVIFLPTGDGLCIVLLNIENPYDIHISIARGIIRAVHRHNEGTDDPMRNFAVRIGVNSNTDNLIIDINGNQNIAGAGINIASRLMDSADGNQILVGEQVFDTLRYREKYMSAFKGFRKSVKHGLEIPIYQFVSEDSEGLNNLMPQAFTAPVVTSKLDKKTAYYFAQALSNESFLLTTVREFSLGIEAGTILLWFLAEDSIRKSEETAVRKRLPVTYKAGSSSIIEQYDHYNSIDIHVRYELAHFIQETHLRRHAHCFQEGTERDFRFINEQGKQKLKEDWRNIAQEFGLD